MNPPLAPEDIFGMFAAIGEIKEDIISPIDETWNALTHSLDILSKDHK